MNTETMKQSFQERLFVYQTAVPAQLFEDDVRSIAALASELLSDTSRSIKMKPADYGISDDAADFLYYFNVDLQDDGSIVFVPGSDRDTAARAFGQAVALMPGYSDLRARFGLQPAPAAAAASGVAAHGNQEELQAAVFAHADPLYERTGPLPRQTGLDPSVRSQRQGERHVAASATASPHPSVMQSGSIDLPPTDNRFAELTTPPQQLLPLAGLHVVEIMEEFAYHVFMLTTRIPFRILFKQCKRLADDYSTHDDAMKLFNAVCCRIEQTGVSLNFWSLDDVRLASIGQSDNSRVSMYNVIKSMVQQSLDHLSSEQHRGRQASEHYTTIWQLKEDFAQMIRVFWQQNATEPAYVMFVFDLHQKLAYLNVKWTLGLPMRMSQDLNLRDTRIDQRDAREMLNLTSSVPDVFSPQYIDAMKALRSYFSLELQKCLSGKEHLEHISLVRWLSDNAKRNVIRPTANEVRLSSIGDVSQPQAVLRLLEQHGLQSTGNVYDEAQEIAASSSFSIQGGDSELQLALEMSKQQSPVQQDDDEDQMRYVMAVSASENTAQGVHSEVGVTGQTISRTAYSQYGNAINTPVPSSVIERISEDSSDGYSQQRGGRRSLDSQHYHQLEPQPHQTQVNELPRQQHQPSHHGTESDSGLAMTASGSTQQNTSETGTMALHANSLTTTQMSSGRSLLPRHVVTDQPDKLGGHPLPRPVTERTLDEDSDSGESKLTLSGDESDDEGMYRSQTMSGDPERMHNTPASAPHSPGFGESGMSVPGDEPHGEEVQRGQTSVRSEHKDKAFVVAPHSTGSLLAGQPSARATAFGEETMMEHASQLLDLLRQHDYVQVNKVLKNLQGNVQQRLSLRSLGRDFLLKVVCQYAKEEDLAEMVQRLVQTDRVERETLESICEKLDISVSNRPSEMLKHLINLRGKQQ